VLWLFGLVALCVAAVFAAYVPRRDLVYGATGARFLIVRWGHSGVWLLLAIYAFLLALGLDTPLGLAAGLLYIVFIVTFLSLAR
jgi:hypothetical protein